MTTSRRKVVTTAHGKLGALFLICAGLLAGLTSVHAADTAQGLITSNGKKLKIKSAYATTDAKHNSIIVALFPFDLTADDVEQIQEHRILGVVRSKPSPDPSTWEHSPYARLAIHFVKGSSGYTKNNIDSYVIFLHEVAKKGQTDSFGISTSEAVVDINNLSVQGDELQLLLKRIDTGGGTRGLDYQFQVKTKLYPP